MSVELMWPPSLSTPATATTATEGLLIRPLPWPGGVTEQTHQDGPPSLHMLCGEQGSLQTPLPGHALSPGGSRGVGTLLCQLGM